MLFTKKIGLSNPERANIRFVALFSWKLLLGRLSLNATREGNKGVGVTVATHYTQSSQEGNLGTVF